MISKERLASECGGVSAAHFWRLVNREPAILKRLTAAGYRKTQKFLTARQERIVRDHFDITPPDENEKTA